MENKYFTPDIEELHISYELEINYNFKLNDIFHKKIINSFEELTDMHSRMSGDCVIRVPYLTKEQLENEGWKYYQKIPDAVVSKGYVEYYKDVEWFKIVISISETSHYLTVEKVFQNVQIGDELQEFRNTIYNGECKDINTFRKICKLLGI